MGIKLRSSDQMVYCFMGEMTAETGIAHECIKYSKTHKLPIKFIVEDNGLSVCTDTRKTWCMNQLSYELNEDSKVVYYRYTNKYPHAGAGKRVQF